MGAPWRQWSFADRRRAAEVERRVGDARESVSGE